MSQLEFVTFKWGSRYAALHVNILADMLRRHCQLDHRLTCITDDPEGIDQAVRVMPMWSEKRLVGDCMQRIRMFQPAMGRYIGPRFCWLDLDMVIAGDVTELFARTEPFVACGVEKSWQPYNGSMVMMDAGAHPEVYQSYSLLRFMQLRRKTGYGAGDQGWIACALGPDMPKWTELDGVYSYRDHIEPELPGGTGGALPAGARLVIFNSKRLDPSSPQLQARSPWIAAHWRRGP